jgi:hypothetical protein
VADLVHLTNSIGKEAHASCGCALLAVMEQYVGPEGVVAMPGMAVVPCGGEDHVALMSEAAAQGGELDEIIARFEEALK